MVYTRQRFPPVAMFSSRSQLIFIITMRTTVSVSDRNSTPRPAVNIVYVKCSEYCVDSSAQDVFNRHTNDKNKPPERV